MPKPKRRKPSSGGDGPGGGRTGEQVVDSRKQMKRAATALLLLVVALYVAQLVLFANPVGVPTDSPEILSRASAEEARPPEVVARGDPMVYKYEVRPQRTKSCSPLHWHCACSDSPHSHRW